MVKFFFTELQYTNSQNKMLKIGLVFRPEYLHLCPKTGFLPITLSNSVPKRDREKKSGQKIQLVFSMKKVIAYFFRKSIETLYNQFEKYALLRLTWCSAQCFCRVARASRQCSQTRGLNSFSAYLNELHGLNATLPYVEVIIV